MPVVACVPADGRGGGAVEASGRERVEVAAYSQGKGASKQEGVGNKLYHSLEYF